jgi:phosphoglycerate-specific signal transduction histidine kinase
MTRDEQIEALAKAKIRAERDLNAANQELVQRAKLLAVAANTITILSAAADLNKEDARA